MCFDFFTFFVKLCCLSLVLCFVFFFKQKTAYEMLRSLVGSEMCIRDQRIVQHCLEKKPGERFQSARDVAFALQALSGSATAAAMAQPPGRRWSWRWVALSVVLAV